MRKWAKIAICTKSHTLDGRLVVRQTTDLPFLFYEGMEVCFVPPKNDVPRFVKIQDFVAMHDDSFVIKFKDIDNIQQADNYIGCHMLAQKSQLRMDSSKSFIHSLIDNNSIDEPFFTSVFDNANLAGYQIVDKHLGPFGKVLDLIDRPVQQLLVVENNKQEYLVPFVSPIVASVDHANKVVNLDCPNGLFNLD